ncbi:MAG: transporter substrate-binding domain-containing protein [Spirochaetaceae bacterium]|jgi:polar amino acid transport system substrate-binding protein|nr:transporter substrate-binding domain-containing protein [Spirochaetaceae bacterium]
MLSIFSRSVFAACVVAAAFSVASCGQKWRGVDDIKKKGELVLYTDATWPPYEYVGDGGRVEGVDVDIGREIAGDLGVELRVINASFDGFSLALQNGQADVAISAITITPERQESLDFSLPYSSTVQFIVKLAADTHVQSFADLAGRRIGVQLGTTGDILVSDAIREGALKDTGAQVLQFKALQEAMLGLFKGDPFAIVCDDALARNLVAVNPGSTFIPVNSPGNVVVEDEYYGAAIVKGNTTLVNAVNKTLARLIETGEIERRVIFHTANSALYEDDNAQ